MSNKHTTTQLLVNIPDKWPSPPTWWSISTLNQIEKCPKSWALQKATYPDVWDGKGYPQNINISRLEGTIVHLTLETLFYSDLKNGLVSNSSIRDTLIELGGYSIIIERNIDLALESYIHNPRTIPIIEHVRRSLNHKIPNLRFKVQRFLQRLTLDESDSAKTPSKKSVSDARMGKLGYGNYTEVTLKSKKLSFHGIADLITISKENCSIRDYKTGVPNDNHLFQIKAYALLWYQDEILNPSERFINNLVISYEDSDLELKGPDEEELSLIEKELLKRIRATRDAINAKPPEAIVNRENCEHCDVRHLCENYWDDLLGQERESDFIDLQLKIVGMHGPSSWDAIAVIGHHLTAEQKILLRTSIPDLEFYPKQQLRICNAHISHPILELSNSTPDEAIVTIGINSEVFLISDA